MQASGKEGPANDFAIEPLSCLTPELAEAMARLVPQLSPGRLAPSRAEIESVLADDRLHLLVARAPGGGIQGAVALVFYRVPTGLRARVEDLVVSTSHRGLGLGKALMLRAIEIARAEHAHVLDLTSNPSRVEANRLYQTLGFERWETNVYRKVLDEE